MDFHRLKQVQDFLIFFFFFKGGDVLSDYDEGHLGFI